MAVKLGDLLLKQKLITQEQLEAALKLQREEGGKIGEASFASAAVSERRHHETLSQQFGVPSIDLAHFEIDPCRHQGRARRGRPQVRCAPGEQNRRDR
jgi:hypothetical protein